MHRVNLSLTKCLLGPLAQELIVFLLLALGAGSVTVASDESRLGGLHRFDVVILKDDEALPQRLANGLAAKCQVVDEEWVKQCVIVGHRVAFKLWKPVRDAMEAHQAQLQKAQLDEAVKEELARRAKAGNGNGGGSSSGSSRS